LHAREAQAERGGQRARQGCLSNARGILDQEVPARDRAHEALLDHSPLADDRSLDDIEHALRPRGDGHGAVGGGSALHEGLYRLDDFEAEEEQR
jgi:hypothetical protein